jgi:putative acetyltransferase
MTEIKTPRLLLRPIVEGDAEAIYAYSRNPNVGVHAGWKPHESIDETREVMKTVFLGQENVFGVVLKETGILFGSIGLVADPKRQNDKARMIGYAIGEEHWGRGYTTEAARAIIRYGFGELGLELISGYCYPNNERSRRVMTKCGMRLEGVLRRGEIRYDGAVLDHECYSITQEEYV